MVKFSKENFNFITNTLFLLILIFGSLTYAVGFHTANEILPGQFANGDFIFNGSLNVTGNLYGPNGNLANAIIGPSPGKEIRIIELVIQYDTATTIKVTGYNRYNSNAISIQTNLAKGSTLGGFYLAATGAQLTILDSAITGSCSAVLSVNAYYNTNSGIIPALDSYCSGGGIYTNWFRADNGQSLDLVGTFSPGSAYYITITYLA